MADLSRFRQRPTSALLPLATCHFLIVVLLCTGCSGAQSGVPSPSPEEIPSLEAELARRQNEVATKVRLGAAYRAAGRPDRALALLQEAQKQDPQNGGAVLFLGLTLEDLGEFARARELYQAYLALGDPSPLRARVERRLPLLARRELQAAVARAIAGEVALAEAPPRPGTVAVFPFYLASSDTALSPLSLAMAEMLITDLSQTERLIVLERTRVQFLLDELGLEGAGLVAPETAARGGRLLGAERLVQGTLGGGGEAEIRFDAALVSATSGEAGMEQGQGPAYAASAPGNVVHITEEDALPRLFDLEKRLALRTFDAMGIELTPAERERVNRRPTENLQALLAYGRGLRAADAGDFRAAALQFREALRLDPNFTAARMRAEEAERLAIASLETTNDLAEAGAFETRLPVAFGPLDLFVPGVGPRDPAQEIMGTEGFEPATVVEVIINRPGGL